MSTIEFLWVQPKIEESGKKAETLPGWHHFCKLCGTQMWIWEPSSPEMINPMASSVDSTLPTPPERHHIFLKDKAPWVSTNVFSLAPLPSVLLLTHALCHIIKSYCSDWHSIRLMGGK